MNHAEMLTHVVKRFSTLAICFALGALACAVAPVAGGKVQQSRVQPQAKPILDFESPSKSMSSSTSVSDSQFVDPQVVVSRFLTREGSPATDRIVASIAN